ncbi:MULTISPECIES: bifunctional adenosylcobinamide kinase/adenosylcobinamide-phosphate guanylyltransferase [unclassified Streptomyces]|uniref:bifunctional adenosylcobinamide kinase/adenosylcobinamide-phosphate guanylyltransferase n=1 Tax=unclassified Streptomyces TaxID=2593676 RepID=UPI00088F3D78|nr:MULTISPECIES: bifunctional adenosylcobinamide kinase/adenosylcobinamide-phosphate guanylyltransferase [unclassified Streptomyces]PBC81991.1 adenosylcobinamide kinase /adenosylcobinamide-phosphate guanylyltransferase [Streptomyces sp. 2321.6]SDR52046.1 adenosylcobinamide kinase /adenosylcobinamide-phosphate guanylyltransferase [Streptomyces sp. KS_16]SEC39048.1 adenosylcobinamide kinase /adenosylcobinamide-phosphate guanylyltransferase [Streptomyces sp. 2133.1]SNC67115.1 adenosylcobinamide ki
MDVTLLGTGAPQGLPRPTCPCAACATAVGDEARAATALLVDGALMIDLTPGPAFAAARAGQSLAGVRQVLLSHPHDGPALEVPAGMPQPGRVADGRELALLDGHRVRAVAVDIPGTGYEISGADGERLLYLPPGAAPAGLGNGNGRAAGGGAEGTGGAGPYDLVLLDVVKRPDALARLRASGAVDAATDVVAVHLDHGVPPGPELHRRLAAVGARAVADGSTLVVGEFHAVPDLPRRTLVLGGARSGKSVEAERRLAAFPEVVYVATGGTRDGDQDWAQRVALHRERRPGSWRTVETCDLLPLLGAGPDTEAAGAGAEAAGPGREGGVPGAEDGGPGAGPGPGTGRPAGTSPLLIDCLALWLTHVMDDVGAWDDATWEAGGREALRKRTDALVAALRETRRPVVAVSNEVGSGVVPATPAGRRFRDELGRLNAAFAAECEQVLLVVAGQALALRG